MEYTDSRLFIHVTPLLEHKLPMAARTVKDFLHGNVSEDVALQSLAELMTDSHNPVSWDKTPLDKECCDVCIRMFDHLQDISNMWLEYLQNTASVIKDSMRKAMAQKHVAEVVRSRYLNVNPRIVESEFRNELKCVGTRMDSEIELVRKKTEPDVRRSESLKSACENLKRSFSESYGALKTEELVRCRTLYEANVRLMQYQVAKDFVDKTITLLK